MATDGPHLERLAVRNYRALRNVTLDGLSPLTVLSGPNGSGKSTVLDALAFLQEALTTNLRHAWEARGSLRGIRSRGAEGPVAFELLVRPGPEGHLASYRLEVDERDGAPVVVTESLRWSTSGGQELDPPWVLNFTAGAGRIHDDATGQSVDERLVGADVLAVGTLGQLGRYARLAQLRRIVAGWSFVAPIAPDALPRPRTSGDLDDLSEIVRHLQERHPDRLDGLLAALRERVPGLETVRAEESDDGRVVLRLKDAAFSEPIEARHVSSGTSVLLALLAVLRGPSSATLVGLEEPENQLHPRLHWSLAEDARAAAEERQIVVTTHSPQFADALRSPELWVLHRGDDGFTRAVRASDVEAVETMVEAGGQLGDLWMEGYFGTGDPMGGPWRAS